MTSAMKIGEAARRVGLPVKTLRHYADIGLVAPAEIRDSGFRAYGETELRRLRMVARARAAGFSIDECRRLMRLIDDPAAAEDDLIALAFAKRADLDRRLAELLSLRATLDALLTLREETAARPSPDPPAAPRADARPAERGRPSRRDRAS